MKPNTALDVRIWDVDHGSAAFLRAGNKNVLLDCGAQENFSPAEYISNQYGINTIHYMIISHPHNDHIEDLDMVDECDLKPNIFSRNKADEVREIIEEKVEDERDGGDQEYVEDAEYYLTLDDYSGTPDPSPRQPEWASATRSGDGFRSDGGTNRGVTFHNYFPSDPQTGDDEYEKLNNSSSVTIVNCFGFKYVSVGDKIGDGIDEFMADQSQGMSDVEDANVLVAPHHGRKSSLNRDFVDHVNPDLVAISDMSEEDAESAAGKYGEMANGAPVRDEDSDRVETRHCLTTRNDGRIRITANNSTSWLSFAR